MSKGGRSRSAKRPTSVVKRAAAASAPPKQLANVAVTATAKLRPPPPAATALAPPLTTTKAAPALTLAITTLQATKPSSLSPVEQWVSAFTRGFPYVLAEYCLFLLAVFAGPKVAISVGAILVILVAINRMANGKVLALLPINVVHEAETLLGQRDDVLISLGIIGVGLLCWAAWNGTGVMLFSWLSIVALLAALFVLFYAQRIQTPRETGTS